MSNSLIVNGEASETDSESDTKPEFHFDMTHSIQGAVVLGEDSESDGDNEGSVASAVSALQLLDESNENNTSAVDYNSLFQQKLRECNTALYNNLESFVQKTADETSNNLNGIEHQLLKSQITLQGAVTSLKTLSVNSLTLKNKMYSLLSSKFLSNISVNTSDST